MTRMYDVMPDAATREYIRQRRSEIMRVAAPVPRGGKRPLETHEERVAEVEEAISEYRKVMPSNASTATRSMRSFLRATA